MPRAQVARRAFPPSARIEVLAMAPKKPATYHCPATRWSLDDLVAALWQHRLQRLSRSSIWRMLEEADLKPHRSVYWLRLLLDSRVVELPSAYHSTFGILSSLKLLFFNSLNNEFRFSDNAGA
jgi:hypothetical protein